MSVVETDVGLVDLSTLCGIVVCRDEIALRLDPSAIFLRGPGVHRTLCDFLYGATPSLTRGTVKCVFDPSRPLATIERVQRGGACAPGLGRPLAWPIPQELLLLEGKKGTWLWSRALFRQLAYSKRANGAYFLAIGPAFYRIDVDPKQDSRFRDDLLKYFPRSPTALTADDRNAFTIWPENTYKMPLVRTRFAAKAIEELPGYDPAIWQDPATHIIASGFLPPPTPTITSVPPMSP